MRVFRDLQLNVEKCTLTYGNKNYILGDGHIEQMVVEGVDALVKSIRDELCYFSGNVGLCLTYAMQKINYSNASRILTKDNILISHKVSTDNLNELGLLISEKISSSKDGLMGFEDVSNLSNEEIAKLAIELKDFQIEIADRQWTIMVVEDIHNPSLYHLFCIKEPVCVLPLT